MGWRLLENGAYFSPLNNAHSKAAWNSEVFGFESRPISSGHGSR